MMNTTIPGETKHVYKRWVKPENGLRIFHLPPTGSS
jgi:hypothetical protein